VSKPPQPGFPIYFFLAALAALLGFILARRRAEHRPVALFLVSMTAIDLGRAWIARLVDFDGAPRPHTSAAFASRSTWTSWGSSPGLRPSPRWR